MVRAQCCHCRNITGGPQIFGASLAQGHAHVSSGYDFMMGLGKHQLRAKFEVASFNRCRNIKGEPPNFGSCPSPGPRPLFLLRVILWWSLANPSCLPNLNSLFLLQKYWPGTPNFVGLPYRRAKPTFPRGLILRWPLANSSCMPNLNSVALAVAEMLKGN